MFEGPLQVTILTRQLHHKPERDNGCDCPIDNFRQFASFGNRRVVANWKREVMAQGVLQEDLRRDDDMIGPSDRKFGLTVGGGFAPTRSRKPSIGLPGVFM